jgi:TPP-dependent indolepyruvate ferredoxin oxidoreductase alpha subunit
MKEKEKNKRDTCNKKEEIIKMLNVNFIKEGIIILRVETMICMEETKIIMEEIKAVMEEIKEVMEEEIKAVTEEDIIIINMGDKTTFIISQFMETKEDLAQISNLPFNINKLLILNQLFNLNL